MIILSVDKHIHIRVEEAMRYISFIYLLTSEILRVTYGILLLKKRAMSRTLTLKQMLKNMTLLCNNASFSSLQPTGILYTVYTK